MKTPFFGAPASHIFACFCFQLFFVFFDVPKASGFATPEFLPPQDGMKAPLNNTLVEEVLRRTTSEAMQSFFRPLEVVGIFQRKACCDVWHGTNMFWLFFFGSFELEDYSKYGQFTIVGDYYHDLYMTIGWKTSHDLGIHRSIWFWTLIGTYWNAWLFTKLDSRESAIGEVTYEWREWTWIPSMCSSIWRIHHLTGAFYVGNFREWSTG